MFLVTIDAFSGRPNPQFIMGVNNAPMIINELVQNQDCLGDVDTSITGLGFRGIIFEAFSDEDSQNTRVPSSFRIAGGTSRNETKGIEIAEKIIRSLQTFQPYAEVDNTLRTWSTPFDSTLEDYLIRLLPRMTDSRQDVIVAPEAPQEAAICYIEFGRFNPDFWNRSEVIGRNNCYNYASNWRTNTLAQPGRGAGKPIQNFNCQDVIRASLADGLHVRYDCFPDSEKPRWLMALVVAPNWDYHWYRAHKEGFWGHKPGGTAARNIDNSNNIIYNPETCNRGVYTEFCGYFYGCKSQRNILK